MTLQVFTARISYDGPDRLDITRSRKDPVGVVFAPSERILWPVKSAQEEAKQLRAQAADIFAASTGERRSLLLREADELEAQAWQTYAPMYRAEMQISAGLVTRGRQGWTSAHEAAWGSETRPRPDVWSALLARPRVTLCCFCVLGPEQRCHRRLLAGYFARLGAEDKGEIG